MPMVNVDTIAAGRWCYSSNEPGELSQWLCHIDSTINTAVPIDRFHVTNSAFSAGCMHDILF